MTKGNHDFSHDSGFKDLVVDFPEDTVRWLLPEAESRFGPIRKVEFLREQMKKQWLADKGRELDIPLLVTFEKNRALVSLIEHKSEKRSFSIYKLAHYTLDLAEMCPDHPIIPIVIFADPRRWRKDVKRELEIKALNQTWLYFTFKKVKLKDL